MKSAINHFFRKYFEPQAAVLMYHRVAEPEADVWDIAVSPDNFDYQLQILKQSRHVIPLKNLVENIKNNKVKKNSIAITFDDGYADNFLAAKPLLEKYDLPATFFITSSNIGQKTEFWWDELQNLVLFTPVLPDTISITINGKRIAENLGDEATLTEKQRRQNHSWKACDQAAPSVRCKLYFQLWEQLKPLPHTEQQLQLDKLWNWANGTTKTARPAYKSMTHEQVQQLSSTGLFDIGCHTISHAALSCYNLQVQRTEMLVNRRFLNDITGQETTLISYPYGNYNSDTLLAAADAGLEAAFTSDEQLVNSRTHPYKLGRFQVKNSTPETFEKQLSQQRSRR